MPNRILRQATFEIERLLLRGVEQRLLLIALVMLVLSVVGGVTVWLAGGAVPGARGIEDFVWWAFLRLSDPGYLGDDEGALVRVVSTVLTVFGYVIFVGALVAIMTQSLNATLRTLELGLTPIVQNDHIVVLGWTNRAAAIVRELLLSEGRVRRFLSLRGGSKRELRIVILVEELTPQLRAELRDRLGELWNEARIIFRSGSPLRLEHLRRVDFAHAAALVIPAADFDSGGWRASDTRAVKTLLSITNHPDVDAENGPPPAVAEILDARNLDVARSAYGGQIELLASDAMISRLIAQNVRHEGLSAVITELLTHRVGSEIYIREAQVDVGQRLQDLQPRYRQATLLGVVRPTGDTFRPHLNPPAGFRVEAGDRLVLLAGSYESTVPAADVQPVALERSRASDPGPVERTARRVLILGWSHRVPPLIAELGSYGAERFDMAVLSAVPVVERAAGLARYRVLDPVRQIEGDYTVAGELERLEPAAYDDIVLVASDWLESGEQSDARTILGYLRLQALLKSAVQQPHVIVELMDPTNESLFRDRPGEVLISPMILSHVVAQITLRRELSVVFDELFGSAGAEIDFRPVRRYIEAGADTGGMDEAAAGVSFETLRTAVARRGHTALGVRRHAPGDRGRPRVALNPAPETHWQFGAGDEVVVLATPESGS
ncbi:MAG: CASTOR/POLLUX-related putative ion channel [Longimicrobiales bacterium]